jgi:antitoxin component YwqK of YwqJK toxin-antitoxin module
LPPAGPGRAGRVIEGELAMRRNIESTEGEEHVDFHKGGSVRAKGRKLNGELHGFWEWFRKDGTRLRSGYFDRGVQVGEWTTYDAKGNVYKVTLMKAKRAT